MSLHLHRGGVVLVLSLSACGPSTTHEPQQPPVSRPADAGPAEPPPAADPALARQAACLAGEREACDAIAEFWSEREVVRAARVTQATADVAALHAGCDRHGHASACFGLALMYKYGTAGRVDGDLSKQYFARVAELGDLNGWRGKPVAAAGQAVLAALGTECTQGRSRACNQQGWAAFAAVQRDKNPADALTAYARACELGSGQGCRWAGHFAYTYTDLGRAGEARVLLERGCGPLGAPGSCAELGMWHEKAGDLASARVAHEQSCREGSRLGCAELGRLLAAGGDVAAGVGHQVDACAAGEDAACAALASRIKAGCAVDPAVPAASAAAVIAGARRFCPAAAKAPECAAVTACK